MDVQVKMQDFIDIEKKLKLYDDTVEGVNYWVYTRYDIWNKIILRNCLGLSVAHNMPQMSVFQVLARVAKMTFAVLKKGRTHKKNVDILFMNHQRRKYNNGYYECIYTDELCSRFENSVVLEHTYQLGHKKPVMTKNLVYTDFVVLKGEIVKLLYKTILRINYRKLLQKIRLRIGTPLQELKNLYGDAVDSKKIERRIADVIIEYKAVRGYYEKMITAINPKVMVEVVAYSFDCMLATEICKEKNIPVIELQHGTINEHLAYEYAFGSKIKQFPDRIFLYSQFWKNQIHVPIESDSLIVTGFPYYERQKKEAEPIPKYMDEKVNILFISQGEIGDKLARLAVELSKEIDTSRYRIIFKLHPGEYAIWEERYSELDNGIIEIVDNDMMPLYNYFVSSAIQVGVHSTALYEGIGFGLHTYIYNISRADRMQRLCDMRYAEIVNDCAMLVEKIMNIKEGKKETEGIWEVNALNNMVYNLNKFI